MQLFATYDIETINIKNNLYPFAIGIFYLKKFKSFYLDKSLNYEKLINDSIFYIFQQNIEYIYVHNLDRFDSIFLIKFINNNKFKINIYAHNKHIYKIEIKNLENNNSIIFIDSYKIIQINLKDACETFNVKHKKLNIDFNLFTLENIYKFNIKQYILKYLKHDCISLYEIINVFVSEIYNSYKILFYEYLTITSLALKIWEYHDKEIFIENNILDNKWKDDFIRDAYFGGQTEVIKPYVENGFFYDKNSAYPSIMFDYDFPIGSGIFIIWDSKKYNLNTFFGFLKCVIIAPKDIRYPILPFRGKGNNKLTYYVNDSTWIATYFIAELQLAEKNGYIIRPIEGIMYEKKGKIFKNFISDLFKRKQEAKSSGMIYIYKSLMNSLSGRFGMHSNDIKQHIMDQQELQKFIDNKMHLIKDITDLGNNKFYVQIINNKNYNFHKYSSVQISAAITSYARCALYEVINLLQNLEIDIIYIDTDAIVTNKKIPEYLCHQTELGKFKLVYNIKKSYFLNQKIYFIMLYDNTIIKKFKGININYLNNFKDLDKYLERKTNHDIEFQNVSKLIKNFKNFEIYKMDSNILIHLNYDKRYKIFKDNKWIDTIPWKLVDVKDLCPLN